MSFDVHVFLWQHSIPSINNPFLVLTMCDTDDEYECTQSQFVVAQDGMSHNYVIGFSLMTNKYWCRTNTYWSVASESHKNI